MCHLLDKHIPIVNALEITFGSFFLGGDIEGYAIFGKAPLAAAKGTSCEVLTTIIGQRASIDTTVFGPFR